MDLAFEWINQYGYVALFLFLLLGIAGLPIPDEALLTFVGYLSFKGDLHPGFSLFTAFMGSACGITLSYGLGRWLGPRFIVRLSDVLHLRKDHILRAQAWFQHWGKYALPVAYFVPGIRHVAALTAGASNLSVPTFVRFAYSGAFLWCATFLGIGYGLGAEWHHLSPLVHRAVVVVGLVVTAGLTITLLLLWHRRDRH